MCNVEVPPGTPQRRNLAQTVANHIVAPMLIPVGAISNYVYPQHITRLHGAGQMIALRDEGRTGELEDVSGAIAGIVGSPSRVIQDDVFSRHALVQRVFQHLGRFIVLDDMVGSAEQQLIHLPGAIELDGGIQPLAENQADDPIGPVSGSEDDGDRFCRYCGFLPAAVYSGSITPIECPGGPSENYKSGDNGGQPRDDRDSVYGLVHQSSEAGKHSLVDSPLWSVCVKPVYYLDHNTNKPKNG